MAWRAALLGRWFDRPVVMSAPGTDVSLIPEWRLQRDDPVGSVRAGAGDDGCRQLRDALIELGAAPGQIGRTPTASTRPVPPARGSPSGVASLIDGAAVLSVGALIDRKA
jgi:hypothetical protein